MSNDIELLLKISCYLLLALLIQITSYGSANKRRVHLKILVPDIIKHHIHTKVVFVHLHKPASKKPKTNHKEHHQENWSSWSYGRHHDYNDEHEYEHSDDHEDQHDREKVETEKPQTHKIRQKLPSYHKDSYFPQSYVEDNNVEPNPGRQHGQYAVHEDVNDIPPNREVLSYNYEEGYKKGLETESGHIRTGQTNKFHEDQHEEQDEAGHDGFREDFHEKTDAGRYLVDDVEYENTRDKREGGRRLRRIKGA
ncbi:uncharacterized protein LOC122395271 [Colletes gigas]|uniref:uncharacterized protein LOC122395271 n=1 Tax=Colletes gigas TaxID=935657 RepID=UPI001C9B9A9C|nr:uncharacterized protein LOC122395271 [Colletes gigas]